MGISSPVELDESDTGLRKRKRRPAARSRVDYALHAAQLLLLTTGATLLVVYAAAQFDAVRTRAHALEAFDVARGEHAAVSESPATPSPAPLEYSSAPDQALWSAPRIAAYRDSVNVARDIPLGVLTIASVELEAPIFEGTAALTLNRGIGRIEGTAEVGASGNLGLAGHRDGYFRVLKDVRVGDTIDVQSLASTTRYRISEISIVEPSDVHVLAPTGTATLTLVTCYPFYFIGEAPQRYIVQGVAESFTAGDAP
ncbi:MAG TPA: class D sortase [Gammaproteobacteria bacterium]